MTPAFMHGADASGRAELRPPAFRGVLRYWLRVALGGVIGDSNLPGLHKLETAVFGSTSVASPVSVRLSDNPRTASEALLPHKPFPVRQAFVAGSELRLFMQMTCRRDPATWKKLLKLNEGRDLDAAVWEMACAVLKLALTFGGVGQRARRGYGTMQIVTAEPAEALELMPTDLDAWHPYIAKVSSSAIQAATSLARQAEVATAALPSDVTRFPCASALGLIGTCDLRANEATAALATFMRAHRPEYTFGGITPREASPLWVRPIKTGHAFGLLLCALGPLGLNHGKDYYDHMRGFLSGLPGWQEIPPVKGWNT